MAVDPDTGVITNDSSFDWGARFRPDPTVSPVAHLGGMPNVIENLGTQKLDKALPKIDPDHLVVPPSNVPLTEAVRMLVDKVFSDKEKEKLFTEENLGLTGPPTPSEKDVAKAAKVEEKNVTELNAAKADEPANQPVNTTPPASTT